MSTFDRPIYMIPYLPEDAPMASNPAELKLPLFEHQRRSLYRLLQIESNGRVDKEFSTFNFGGEDCMSKGGCLCDAIGMGKTATILALICSESCKPRSGANLIIAPPHLLAQWKNEVAKFVNTGEVNVIMGMENYLQSTSLSNRTIVLCSVDEVLNSQTYDYSFRVVSDHGNVLNLTKEQLSVYRSAAIHVSKGYTGPLWVSKLFMPEKPWRRVIFEEVQDLVESGKQSHDCFVQLARTAANVWLVTATPFPRLSASVKANNELMGLRRLLIDCEGLGRAKGLVDTSKSLRDFESIKLRLYLRNPEPVRAATISENIPVEEVTIQYALTSVEKFFYDSEIRHCVVAVSPAQAVAADSQWWRESFLPVRQSICHPALSRHMHDMAAESGLQWSAVLRSPVPDLMTRFRVWSRSRLSNARSRLTTARLVEEATRNSLAIVRAQMEWASLSVDGIFQSLDIVGLGALFAGPDLCSFRGIGRHLFGDEPLAKKKKKSTSARSDYFTRPPEEHVIYGRHEVQDYLQRWCSTRTAQEHFVTTMTTNLHTATTTLNTVEAEVAALEADMKAIEEFQLAKQREREQQLHRLDAHQGSLRTLAAETDLTRWCRRHGSKVANLLLYLKERFQHTSTSSNSSSSSSSSTNSPNSPHESGSGATVPALSLAVGSSTVGCGETRSRPKVIVFSMWDELLSLAARALALNSIKSVIFPQEDKKPAARDEQAAERHSAAFGVLFRQPQTSTAAATRAAFSMRSAADFLSGMGRCTRSSGLAAVDEDSALMRQDDERQALYEKMAKEEEEQQEQIAQQRENRGLAEQAEADAASMSRARALDLFIQGDADVLLLSSLSSASGINLQIASEVIFLDAPGLSSVQGGTLEQQAIGRVVRLGQNKPVRVVRLMAADTCEPSLFADVAGATHKATSELRRLDGTGLATTADGSSAYVCQGYSAALPVDVQGRTAEVDAEDDAEDVVEVAREVSAADGVAARAAVARSAGELVFIDCDDTESESESESESGQDGEGGVVVGCPPIATSDEHKQDSPVGPTPEADLSPLSLFHCPLSGRVMTDPVVCSDGYSYERAEIEKWMCRGGGGSDRTVLSPVTGEVLPHTMLVPNLALKRSIQNSKCSPTDAAALHRADSSGSNSSVATTANSTLTLSYSPSEGDSCRDTPSSSTGGTANKRGVYTGSNTTDIVTSTASKQQRHQRDVSIKSDPGVPIHASSPAIATQQPVVIDLDKENDDTQPQVREKGRAQVTQGKRRPADGTATAQGTHKRSRA